MHVFETPGSVSLHIRLPAGRVVVAATEDARTTVELVSLGRRGGAPEDVVVTARERPGGHEVVVEQKDRIRFGPLQIAWGRVEARIACPRGADLELTGASTDLEVEGELGEVSVRTASGDVRLGPVSGPLQAKTASGDVWAALVRSDSSVVTVSGDVRVDAVEAPLTVRAVSGDVRVGRASAPLTVSTTSGDVQVEAVAGGEVRVQTVSGDARLGVARGTRVWIDAVSVSGDLSSELGLEDAPGEGAPAEDAVVPLHVKTVSGDVAIVRAAERAPA